MVATKLSSGLSARLAAVSGEPSPPFMLMPWHEPQSCFNKCSRACWRCGGGFSLAAATPMQNSRAARQVGKKKFAASLKRCTLISPAQRCACTTTTVAGAGSSCASAGIASHRQLIPASVIAIRTHMIILLQKPVDRGADHPPPMPGNLDEADVAVT